MINFGKIIERVVTRMETILIEPKRCCRVRSPRSKCTFCVDACPVDALTFDKEGITLVNNCLECGLCAGACPTEALSLQEPNELHMAADIDRSGKDGEAVVVACRESSNIGQRIQPGQRLFIIPCIGSLSAEFLFFLNTCTFTVHVIYSQEACQKCSIFTGEKNFLIKLERVKVIQQSLQLNDEHINLTAVLPDSKSANKEGSKVSLDRRAFISSIFTGIKKVPQATLESMTVPSEKNRKLVRMEDFTTDRILLLHKRLADLKEEISDNKEVKGVMTPFLESTCYFCKACSILCPVGAIEYNEEGPALFITKSRCTGCGLCVDICISKSLSLKPTSLEKLLANKPEVLASGKKCNCIKCGQELVASGEDNCLNCNLNKGLQSQV